MKLAMPRSAASSPLADSPHSLTHWLLFLMEFTLQLMAEGMVDILHDWMLTAKDATSSSSTSTSPTGGSGGLPAAAEIAMVILLKQLLLSLSSLPVDMAFLKTQPICKTLGQLRKHPLPEVSAQAKVVVDVWYKRATGGKT